MLSKLCIRYISHCGIFTIHWEQCHVIVDPLDAGRLLTDVAQTSYAAGSLLTDCTVNERSG